MNVDLDELHAAMDCEPTVPHPLLEAIWNHWTKGTISMRHWHPDPTLRWLNHRIAIADWLYSVGDPWPRPTSPHYWPREQPKAEPPP